MIDRLYAAVEQRAIIAVYHGDLDTSVYNTQQ